VKESKIYQYYAFGWNYSILRKPIVGAEISGEIERLKRFFDTLAELNLQVTQTAAEKLKEVMERLERLPKGRTLDQQLATEIRDELNKIDATLDAELKLRTAFIVTPKRIHVDHLLNSPQSLFGQDVFTGLPIICQFDFKEGCRCVAFAMSTAAAFHFMRATEGLLRELYCHVVKRDRIKTLLWSPMVEHLRKRRGSPVPKPLLDNLDNIRLNFRNPISHPEARFEMDEIQDLLPLTIDVANRIVKLIGVKKK
jgi:hypothetical protein